MITYNSTGTQNDSPQFMKLFNGNLYIAGITTVSGSNTIGVVQKISASNGAVLWTSIYNNNAADVDNLYSLDVYPSRGTVRVFAVGTTKSNVNGLDALLLQYDDSGNLLCSDIYNNPNKNLDDEFASIQVTAPADAFKIYVTGRAQTSTGCAASDYLTIHYAGCNTRVWTKTFTGSQGCPTAATGARMLRISPYSGKIYVTGMTYVYAQGNNATTVRYNAATGVQEWSDSFDRFNAANEVAVKFPMAIGATNNCGNEAVYITGYTRESSLGPNDCTTFQYDIACCPTCEPGVIAGLKQNYSDANLSVEVEIYPNPFSQIATFRFTDGLSHVNSTIIIYDITGAEVKRMENITTNEVKINSENMKPGNYFYRRILEGNELSSGKFILAD